FPGHLSRWEWCRRETSRLAEQLAPAISEGITVIPFADQAERHPNLTAEAINQIFRSSYPNGMTMLDQALGLEIDHFLFDRAMRNSSKPLLMAVITDGAPNDPQKVVDEIIHVSRKIKKDEVKIVFFVIGDDPMSQAFLDYVHKCNREAALEFDIVSSRSFAEIRDMGLAKSLATELSACKN
ncbi:MAG: VWA domain-containing protein, partial [Candidatus Obscuribacterales bacterium]|nr:VWA domain-containing protein [Candidatus Obscuribacterales bacterium]